MDASNETPSQQYDSDDDDARHTERPLIGPDRRAPRMRVDLTINIPTMISIAVLIVTTSATGVGLYYNLDKRQMATDFAVASQTQRIDKIEASVSALKAEQAGQNAQLRGEMKSDITEIKDLLNRLIFAPSSQQQRQLREWSK